MIRRATPDDVVRLAALDAACFASGSWTADQIADSLTVPGRGAWISSAGYAMAHTAGDVTELERIAVDPLERRSGVGRALLDAVCEHAADRGSSGVLMEVESENEPAVALYRTFGGRQVGFRRDYYGRGRDALVLRIEVGP